MWIVELHRVKKQLLVAAVFDDVFDSGDRVQPPLRSDQTEADARSIHRRQLSPGPVARIVSIERGATTPRATAVTAGDEHEISQNDDRCELEDGIKETRVGFLGENAL